MTIDEKRLAEIREILAGDSGGLRGAFPIEDAADDLLAMLDAAREEAAQWHRKAQQTDDVRLRDALLEREAMRSHLEAARLAIRTIRDRLGCEPGEDPAEVADVLRENARNSASEARMLQARVAELDGVVLALSRRVHRLTHGEEIDSDRICEHALALQMEVDAMRERAEDAERKLAALREAARRSFMSCPFDCTIESYCGRCAHLVEALAIASRSPTPHAHPRDEADRIERGES